MAEGKEQYLMYLLQGYFPITDFVQHSLFYHYGLLHRLLTHDRVNDIVKVNRNFKIKGTVEYTFYEGQIYSKQDFLEELMSIFDFEYGTNFSEAAKTWNRI